MHSSFIKKFEMIAQLSFSYKFLMRGLNSSSNRIVAALMSVWESSFDYVQTMQMGKPSRYSHGYSRPNTPRGTGNRVGKSVSYSPLDKTNHSRTPRIVSFKDRKLSCYRSVGVTPSCCWELYRQVFFISGVHSWKLGFNGFQEASKKQSWRWETDITILEKKQCTGRVNGHRINYGISPTQIWPSGTVFPHGIATFPSTKALLPINKKLTIREKEIPGAIISAPVLYCVKLWLFWTKKADSDCGKKPSSQSKFLRGPSRLLRIFLLSSSSGQLPHMENHPS